MEEEEAAERPRSTSSGSPAGGPAAGEDIAYCAILAASPLCKVIKEAVTDATQASRVRRGRGAGCQVRQYGRVACSGGLPSCGPARSDGGGCANATNVLKKAMARLEELSLYNNNLGDEGAAAIAAAAAAGGLPRLESLCLAKSKIGDAGVQALASAFAGGAFPKLDWLGLSRNKIGDAGLIAIAEALEKGRCRAQVTVPQQQLDRRRGYKGADGGGQQWRLANLVTLHLYKNETNQLGKETLETLVLAIEDDKLPRLNHLMFDAIREPSADYTRSLNRLSAACQHRGISLVSSTQPM